MSQARLVVEHSLHGPGLLLSSPPGQGNGLPLVVRFQSGLRAVAREQLTLSDGSSWPELPPPYRPEPLSPVQRRCSRWLEALRLGTVEGEQGERITVGREAEVSLIDKDLELVARSGGACRVFCGPYGSGKSHLLEVLARRASQAGLAVSRVVLDRQRVSAHRPRRLYREILAGLSLPRRPSELESSPGPGGGKSRPPWQGLPALQRLIELAASQSGGMGGPDPWEQHPYFSPLLAAWRQLGPDRGSARAQLLYWISGGERQQNQRLRQLVKRESGRDPGPLYALKDHRTVWNQLTSLLTGLSCLIRQTGLAQGLALVIDEAEMCALPSSLDQRHGDRTLTGLCAAALGPRAVRRPELLRQPGGHRSSREFPPFHRGRSHLYLALGMASQASGREALQRLLPRDTFVELSPFSDGEAARLAERIVEIYGQAFPHFELGKGLAAPLVRLLQLRGLCTARQIVQQTMAFLDGARLWPDSVESYLEECLRGI